MSNRVASPVAMELEAGKNHFWCRCGLSQTVPLCDGSHKQVGEKPLVFQVEETKTYYLCRCGATQTPPYCDGSHSKLAP